MSFFDYWGKTRRGEQGGGDDYHLLCWHSLDVAAMGYKMVEHNIYGLATYLQRAGLTCPQQAGQFFAWLLCWHDIGKFARSFQQLYTDHDLPVPAGSRQHYEKISHSALGYWLWQSDLSDIAELLPSASFPHRQQRRVMEIWMPVVTGHHGRPPESYDEVNNFLPDDREAAHDFLMEIKTLFPLITLPDCWGEEEGMAPIKNLSWPLSALVVLADWIGSASHFFPRVARQMSVEVYWQQALAQAERAITVFPRPAAVAPFAGFHALFPFIQHPTPLQQKVLDLTINHHGPQLFILEDVTGAGKTEAALTLTHRLMAADKAQGLFLGLPTMATANAMYDRLAQNGLAFYQPDSHPSLILAHSARSLMNRFNQAFQAGELAGSEEPDDETPDSLGCAAWFADSNKKALLADIGIGTLDQAMMAVMAFKHSNLRQLGLSRKILLADEIHAYDAYMGRILEELIKKQARDGNTTILLSATLSQQQRDRLIAAFARGAESTIQAPLLGLDDYPWLTQATATAVISQRVETRKAVERSVKVAWLHDELVCLDRIEQAARQGKCIAWIRNSVDDAVKSYRQLIARGVVPVADTLLFHSRFAFCDRQRIESSTLLWFGKQSGMQRSGKVVIATQVIEQSLDIDLDEMISDLAPIDLLIQRAGRLQRHLRDDQGQVKTQGPDEREAPVLQILAPAWSATPQEDWLVSAMRNSAYVYPDHSCLWLTQQVLRQQGAIRMPQAARLLIESVYGDDVVKPEGLVKSSARQEGKYYCDRAFADQQMLNFTTNYSSQSGNFMADHLSTRLAEESVSLWLAKMIEGQPVPYASGDLGWEMSLLRVRKSWWEKHKTEFEQLTGDALQQWCLAQHQNPKFAIVLVISDAPQCGYSAREGLIGQ
ncbi:CRISPR-associated helicase Cas3' [Enterobacteriaceae bacterium ESL0689]|nr:CRISPR-associated helicase Cas3' [Enterobacteriaceae bacterium ESL0689]